jgi:hypothetical protein
VPKSPEWRPFGSEDPTRKKAETEPLERKASAISEEFLERFYASPSFLSKINETSRQARKFGGRELGFGFWKHLRTDQTLFTDIVGGPIDRSVGIREAHDQLESRLEELKSKEQYVILGTFHFHPGISRNAVIVPSGSGGDLGQSYSDRDRNKVQTNYDCPTIEMIGSHLVNEGFKILVYQEPLFYEPMQQPAIRQEIDESLQVLRGTKGLDQEEVLTLLRHYGYKAEAVNTDGQHLSAEALRPLRSFAFAPKPIVRE